MSEVLDAGERLRRLLVVLAYLAHVGSARLDDLASRFSMDKSTLVTELELAACCGLPPYTPDQLLELVVDDETVYAYGLSALSQPPRLTADEGFALAASARALLAVPGAPEDGPLGRALAKLEAVLGEDRVQVELDRPVHLDLLRRMAAVCEMVEIDYLGAKPGDETTRVVEPFSVAAREGRFYLDAYCQLANDWRRFQVARITEVRPTGRRGEPRIPPASLNGVRAFTGGPSAKRVRIALPEGRRALLERYEIGESESIGDGRTLVTIEVGDPYFLGRLMLLLGQDATIVEPADLASARTDLAKTLLARYRGRSDEKTPS